jgi:hypothetical protein
MYEGEKNACRNLMKKPERRIPHHRWEDNGELYLNRIGGHGLD